MIGELDSQNAGTLTTELYRLFASELDTVVLDLEGLGFIDSAGLRCLLVHARATRAGCESSPSTARSTASCA